MPHHLRVFDLHPSRVFKDTLHRALFRNMHVPSLKAQAIRPVKLHSNTCKLGGNYPPQPDVLLALKNKLTELQESSRLSSLGNALVPTENYLDAVTSTQSSFQSNSCTNSSLDSTWSLAVDPTIECNQSTAFIDFSETNQLQHCSHSPQLFTIAGSSLPLLCDLLLDTMEPESKNLEVVPMESKDLLTNWTTYLQNRSPCSGGRELQLLG